MSIHVIRIFYNLLRGEENVRNIKNKVTGESVYPWRHHFNNYMPWEETDFEKWYSMLSVSEKEDFHIDRLV